MAITFRAPDGINETPVSAATPLPVTGSAGGLPPGAVAITAASGNQANASAAATLAAVSGVTNYLTGFQITASGATAAAVVSATVVGILGGTMTYAFTAPIGVAVPAQPLVVTFPTPIPASAANTAIVVTLPALGSGNTHAAVCAQGYQL